MLGKVGSAPRRPTHDRAVPHPLPADALMLATLVALLAAAAIAVPLSRRAGFGSVLGYLVAGVAIGPDGLRLVTDVGCDRQHRQPRRDHAAVPDRAGAAAAAAVGHAARGVRAGHGAARRLRRGAGRAWHTPQALAGPAPWYWAPGLAMSSTAIVLPLLAERELLTNARRPRRLCGAAVPGPRVHSAGGAGAAARRTRRARPRAVAGRGAKRRRRSRSSWSAADSCMRPLFRAIGGGKTPEVFTTARC